MSIMDKINKLRACITGHNTPKVDFEALEKERKAHEEAEKAEKAQKIAKARKEYYKIVGNRPFELGLSGSELGVDNSLYLSNKIEDGIKKMIIVNPIYQFEDENTLKIVGGRMFERQKEFDALTASYAVIDDKDIKNLTADEVNQIKQQQMEKVNNAHIARR